MPPFIGRTLYSTIMELKLWLMAKALKYYYALYSTIMELKQGFRSSLKEAKSSL